MSCEYPKCNCGHDPETAMEECFEKFCHWHCYDPDDKELRASFYKDWRKQLRKKAKSGKDTVPKSFHRHLQ